LEEVKRPETWEDAHEILKEVIVDQLSVEEDQVTPQASFVDDLNADSLDLVELIMSIEEKAKELYDAELEISDDEASSIKTVKDACEIFRDKLAS
jgi:acyl carrier protein